MYLLFFLRPQKSNGKNCVDKLDDARGIIKRIKINSSFKSTISWMLKMETIWWIEKIPQCSKVKDMVINKLSCYVAFMTQIHLIPKLWRIAKFESNRQFGPCLIWISCSCNTSLNPFFHWIRYFLVQTGKYFSFVYA